jgi:hypothetical protein
MKVVDQSYFFDTTHFNHNYFRIELQRQVLLFCTSVSPELWDWYLQVPEMLDQNLRGTCRVDLVLLQVLCLSMLAEFLSQEGLVVHRLLCFLTEIALTIRVS